VNRDIDHVPTTSVVLFRQAMPGEAADIKAGKKVNSTTAGQLAGSFERCIRENDDRSEAHKREETGAVNQPLLGWGPFQQQSGRNNGRKSLS